MGFDSSEYLISVATEFYGVEERVEFITQSVDQLGESVSAYEESSKVLCYGVLAYLTQSEVARVLDQISNCLKSVERIYIGNIPDRDLINFFDPNYKVDPLCERSQIGRWWTSNEIKEVAKSNGNWEVDFIKMPEEFYASKYRFDVLLRRKI